MRSKMIFSSALAASLLIFAGASGAQAPAGNETPEPRRSQTRTQIPDFGGHNGPSTEPDVKSRVMISRGPMLRSGGMEHGEPWTGPLAAFSKMEAQLDNPMVRTALGLTDQQADSLRKLLVNAEIDTIRTGAGIAVDGIQLKELLRADHPDRATVMAKGNEISQSVSQLIDHYLDVILTAKTVLTPQQQEMIRAYMEGHGQEFRRPVPRP
jgi:hypothetical protein